MRTTWRILEGLPRALALEGRAHLIGACLSDGIQPLCAEALDNWTAQSKIDVFITALSHQPLAPGTAYFDGLVYTAASAGKLNREDVAERYRSALVGQGATSLCSYTLLARRGVGAFRLRDLSREGSPGLWYV